MRAGSRIAAVVAVLVATPLVAEPPTEAAAEAVAREVGAENRPVGSSPGVDRNGVADAGITDPRLCPRECRRHLRRARIATRQYRDPAVAVGDGYVPVTDCDESDEGVVGIHFFNDRNGRRLEVRRPEMLIYLPDRSAPNPMRLRLVAIEYFLTVQRDPDGDGPLPAGDYHGVASPERPFHPWRPPVLFGHRFEGPAAHRPYHTLWHYDLHVWAWARNPAGTFAHYNPAMDCRP